MNKYFFVLGNNHSLSKLEIISIFSSENRYFKIIASSKEVLILETNTEIGFKNLMSKLGGTIKIGEIFHSVPLGKFPVEYGTLITDINFFSKLFDPVLTKITFGISVYNADFMNNKINQIYPLINKSLTKIKDFLHSSYKVNFFKSHERYISSVSVAKNKLLTDGFELVVCVGNSEVFFGKTLEIQNFEDYSFRDYQRPGKDTSEGMIPPKLAKIMINISGKSANDTIIDPFCGNGTILQELILLGFRNIFGADFNIEQIQKTNENINWLFEKYNDLRRTEYNIKVIQSDVRKLGNILDKNSFDAVITEPFLGSPKLKHFNLSQIQNEIHILEKLYSDAFYQFKLLTKKGGKIIIVLPAFKFENKIHYLNILSQISNLGFKIFDFNKNNNLNLEVTDRGSIIYFRPDQRVYREIFVFSVDGEGFEPPTSAM